MDNYTAIIDFRRDDVETTLVHQVIAGAVKPLCGDLRSPRSWAGPAPRSNVQPVVHFTCKFSALNEYEAERTVAVMAAAITPLVKRVLRAEVER